MRLIIRFVRLERGEKPIPQIKVFIFPKSSYYLVIYMPSHTAPTPTMQLNTV